MFSLELYIKSMLLMPPFLLHNKKQSHSVQWWQQ